MIMCGKFVVLIINVFVIVNILIMFFEFLVYCVKLSLVLSLFSLLSINCFELLLSVVLKLVCGKK